MKFYEQGGNAASEATEMSLCFIVCELFEL